MRRKHRQILFDGRIQTLQPEKEDIIEQANKKQVVPSGQMVSFFDAIRILFLFVQLSPPILSSYCFPLHTDHGRRHTYKASDETHTYTNTNTNTYTHIHTHTHTKKT